MDTINDYKAHKAYKVCTKTLLKVLKSPEITPKICYCPTYIEEQNRVWGHQEPGILPADLALRAGSRRVGGECGKMGVGLISILRFILLGG